MIAVPYFEKALYEMPEEQLTAASLMALADQVRAHTVCYGGQAVRIVSWLRHPMRHPVYILVCTYV
jgi:hypothetical protein